MVRERAAIQRTPRADRAQRSREDVVDAVAGDVLEAGRRPDARVLRSPPEHDGRARRPRGRRLRGQSDVGLRAAPRSAPGRAGCRPTSRAPGARRAPRAARATRAACGRGARLTASPRTRIALAPPPQDLMTSGRRRAAQRERGRSQLREVSAVRALAPLARPELGRPPRRHLLQQGDVPLPSGEPRGEVGELLARRVGHRAPVEEVPGQDQHRYVSSPPCRATSSPAPS